MSASHKRNSGAPLVHSQDDALVRKGKHTYTDFSYSRGDEEEVGVPDAVSEASRLWHLSRGEEVDLELHVRGSQRSQYLRCLIPFGGHVRLGRSPKDGCAVPWDRAISREHADLCCESGSLRVRCVATARNPVVFRGQAVREISVAVGDTFSIGGTVFEVAQAEGGLAASGQPPSSFDRNTPWTVEGLETVAEPQNVLGEHTYSADELRRIQFGNAPKQLEILSGLPQLISASQSDEELAQSLVDLLLESIPQAEAVAVAHYDVAALPEDVSGAEAFPSPRMMRLAVRDRFSGRFRPSRRLITKTLKQHESVMQIWSDEKSSGRFTITEGLGWAFVAPIPGESCRGWCLYVAGKGASGDSLLVSEDDLRGDLRFTELVAQFIGSIRQIRLLQEQRTQLSAFFSPKVIENIVGAGSQTILTPAEQDVTVLFCDVRGFSRKSERLKHDLPALLRSVDAALGVMTSGILDRDGAVADFQGDAALGFWGWPVPLEDGPVAACRAALAIWQEFRKEAADSSSLLRGFSVGIGVAHGRALAGRMGTARQAKVGVFGPVVNRGSRLEGMTKQFGVPICIDETTAQFVRRLLPPSEGRLRRLAHVCPRGMDTPLTVYALIPPERQCPEVTDEMLGSHEKALQAVLQGRWSEAIAFLELLPRDDGPAKFLRSYLAEHKQAPPDWTGVIPLKSK